MQARSVLLEPVYDFKLEVPEEAIGRAMTDMGKMNGSFGSPENKSGKAVLTGKIPVSEVKDYALELRAYYLSSSYEKNKNTGNIFTLLHSQKILIHKTVG